MRYYFSALTVAFVLLGAVDARLARSEAEEGYGINSGFFSPAAQAFLRWLQSRNEPNTSMEPKDIVLVDNKGLVMRLRVPHAYIDHAGGRDMFLNGSTDHPGGFVSL